MQVGGKWLLYYTAHHAKRKVQCLGVAVADNPKGPFRDSAAEPLVCQYDQGGTIDANPFRDADGQLYLYYKSDGNAVGKTSFIWGQRLSPDGMGVVGQPVALVKDDQPWEWKLVEAPAMVRTPGGYQMFYSAAFFGWDPRSGCLATPPATQMQRPPRSVRRRTGEPDLAQLQRAPGRMPERAGHPAIFQAMGRHFIAFHAWAATSGCRKSDDERYLYIAPLFWKGGKPQIGPSLRAPRAERG